jgi:predicted site-specific integrase-resolvase
MIAAIPPEVRRDGRYSIKETCLHLGIHRDTLRKYTDSGAIRCRLRQDGKKKFYLGAEIIKFWEKFT